VSPAPRPLEHPLTALRRQLLFSAPWLIALTTLALASHHARATEPPGAGSLISHEAPASTDRLIVRYRNEATSPGRRTTQSARRTTLQALQVLGLRATLSHRNAQGAHVLKLGAAEAEDRLREVARALKLSDPDILYAEPDSRLQALATPTDPMYAQQWDYFETAGGLNLPGAWDLSTGSGVVVAVVDTGVRPHADLAANLVDGYDFITDAYMAHDGGGRDADPSDPGDGCTSGASSWHGTHVAGTIAAVANNGIGIAGVAWNAKVMPVRALGCGGGYNSDIADGVMWAAGAPVNGVAAPSQAAKVINLSLGGASACSTTLQNAITAARNKGAVVVVAAGNSNTSVSGFSPANCKGVITVAAIGRAGGRAPYSNYGPEVDVADGILSTRNSGTTSPGADNYDYLQGTSMATPHVAGVAALMLARNPSLTPDEIEVLIKSNTRPFPGSCAGCGTGIVNATAAVKSVFVSTQSAGDVSEMEPNDSHAQAQAISSFPSKVSGAIGSATDLDTYRVSVPVGATLVARLISNAESDYNLAFRGANGAIIATSTRGKGLTDRVSYTNNGRANVDIYVRVSRASGGTGDVNGRYTLELSR